MPARPELSGSGKIGGTYSSQDVKDIIDYARLRGVRVIPEIDTPAHTESWGRSAKLKEIVLKCNHDYEGQFDPTLDLTYDVVVDTFKFINDIFTDDYVHFGGDEIEEECFDERPSIKQWMDEHGFKTYKELEIFYREKQKSLWREITPSKKAIYWANEEIDLPVQSDDVIQWWGVSKNVDALKGRKNEVVLSNYDLLYLDVGVGNRYEQSYGTYITWRKMYSFNPHVETVNVIGA